MADYNLNELANPVGSEFLSPDAIAYSPFSFPNEGGPSYEFQMRGNDDGDPSQPSYIFWRVTGSEDFAAASAPAPPFGGPISDVVVLSSNKLKPTT